MAEYLPTIHEQSFNEYQVVVEVICAYSNGYISSILVNLQHFVISYHIIVFSSVVFICVEDELLSDSTLSSKLSSLLVLG